jgi:lipoyl(octanoyl) transferase
MLKYGCVTRIPTITLGRAVSGGLDPHADGPTPGRALSAYLLGGLALDALLGLQRRLAYDVGGDRESGAVILCDHPTGVTVGREGSRLHVRLGSDDLRALGWPLRWVSRGGGAMLHLPGQVACYPVLALDHLGLTPAAYIRELEGVVINLLRDYAIAARPDPNRPGVRAGNRRIAHLGVAVRGWVSCFGLVLNVDPDLEPFRDVRCDADPEPMTSVQREAPALRVRITAVRQRLVELVAGRFGFDRVSVFHTHPGVFPKPTRHATPTRTR